jgi:hypothetical protein
MRPKFLSFVWTAICVGVAFCSAGQFFVTYAIPSDRPRERAIEDVALMYRVTANLAVASYVAAALLAVNSIAIVVLVWRRPRI